jgi:hypothetical protein
MRELMVERSEAVAALFVGGMEGIREEYDLIGDHRPTASRLPIGGPGGAARQLEPVGPAGEPVTSDVRKQLASHHYPLVAAIVVRHIAELR